MIGQVCLGIIILTFLCGIGSTTMSLVIYSNKEKRVESKPVVQVQKKVIPNQYATFVDDEQPASVLIDDYDYDDLEIGDNIHYE